MCKDALPSWLIWFDETQEWITFVPSAKRLEKAPFISFFLVRSNSKPGLSQTFHGVLCQFALAEPKSMALGKCGPLSSKYRFAGTFLLSEYEEYCSSLKGPERNDVFRREWQPPPDCFVKINFNGATFAETNSTGVGILTCDSSRTCIGWRKRHVSFKASPEHIELLAAATAVEFGKENGWEQIIVEGNCLSVISKLESTEPDSSVLGYLVQDFREIAKLFRSCKFCCVPRGQCFGS
ncbi:hypothetical protein Salat_1706000 [Sesamum alatum]|uniref:RNase H type-1 domain-containing protein n=1 Tax=Sesamum alatum TaxID=300844 RepID=A0AAE2CK49_9LAMI|nr:hypothetical protein Salat_1706000 [Sesamum alatum]